MNLQAVIFDWAGTVVDFGSLCPVQAFQIAFQSRSIVVEPEDIHRFMGIRKWEHLQSVLMLPAVAVQWELTYHRLANDQDVDELYKVAERALLERVAEFADLTPHAGDAVGGIRSAGLKIGSTTGYTALHMERLIPAARQRGYSPDCWVSSDQVPTGRPAPWMIFKNMESLGVYPPSQVVKVGDTLADIEEAANAGVWSVAVVESSSLNGKSISQWESMSLKAQSELSKRTAQSFSKAGAHFVIPNLAGLDEVIDQIDFRLQRGQTPPLLAKRSRY